MKPIVRGSSLFDVEQVAKDALPDIVYREVPTGLSPMEAARNFDKTVAFNTRSPPAWAHLARAGFSYSLKPSGLLFAAARTFNFDRLDDIHQFDFKSDPLTGCRWPQKRYGHSLDVAAVANLLAHHNAAALSAADRRALVLAALLHDILMPPGGETVKHIDMERFDEDSNFPAFVESETFWRFACEHDVDPQAVARIMREEDAPGVLKDLADKIGYVCRDVEHLVSGQDALADGKIGSYMRIRNLLNRCPQPGSFWASVTIEQGQVVIHDVDTFGAFLELRALLFANIYQSPSTRTNDYVYNEVILRWLYETGQLKAPNLLKMTDEDLDRIVDQYVDWTQEESVERLRFSTLQEAQRVQRDWLERGVVFSTVVDYSRSCKPATHFLVPTPSGPQPFAQAYPAQAERIVDITTHASGVLLFYIREPKARFRVGLLSQLTEHRRKTT